MLRRWEWLLSLVLLLGLAGAALHPSVYWPVYAWWTKEAMYQGKPETYWRNRGVLVYHGRPLPFWREDLRRSRQEEDAKSELESQPRPQDGSDLALLAALLQDPDDEVHLAALWHVHLVGNRRDGILVPHLVANLQDPKKAVRNCAAQALGRIDPAKARAVGLTLVQRIHECDFGVMKYWEWALPEDEKPQGKAPVDEPRQE